MKVFKLIIKVIFDILDSRTIFLKPHFEVWQLFELMSFDHFKKNWHFNNFKPNLILK